MAKPYDFYADMYQTHTEIGYLLWVMLALFGFDLALGLLLAWWPRPDVYLVPGIDRYAQVGVHWGAPPPTLAPDLAPGAASHAGTHEPTAGVPDIPVLTGSSTLSVDADGVEWSGPASASATPTATASGADVLP